MAPAGAGMPVKKFADHAGLPGIVDHHVEAREAQPGADRKHQRRDPARRFQFLQAPEIEDQRRRHAEIDEVGEAVELGAEARGALEHARDAAVDAVEQRRHHDRGDRPVDLAFDRDADGGQPRAQRQQRDQIGQQRAHRDRLEAAVLRRRCGIEGLKDHGSNIARCAPRRHGERKRALTGYETRGRRRHCADRRARFRRRPRVCPTATSGGVPSGR